MSPISDHPTGGRGKLNTRSFLESKLNNSPLGYLGGCTPNASRIRDKVELKTSNRLPTRVFAIPRFTFPHR